MPFESSTIPIFQSLEMYLENKYGNWTKIPEPNDRKSGHTILLLDLQRPYYLSKNLKGAVNYDKK